MRNAVPKKQKGTPRGALPCSRVESRGDRSEAGRCGVRASPSLPSGSPCGGRDSGPGPAAHRDLTAAILRAVDRRRTAMRCACEGPAAAGAIQGCHVSSRSLVFPDIRQPCGFFFCWTDCHRNPHALTSGENGIWRLEGAPRAPLRMAKSAVPSTCCQATRGRTRRFAALLLPRRCYAFMTLCLRECEVLDRTAVFFFADAATNQHRQGVVKGSPQTVTGHPAREPNRPPGG